jgi:GT2 family glycosyltransferase/tetratricopeptide (TPR) repeat protein
MEQTRASIVICAWNEWARTRECLDTLRRTLSPRDEVVVVDNGSTDDTARGLRSYGWVRVVTNDENRGFAAGCNQGAAAATGDVLVFLNNDTILTSRWLDPLVDAVSDPAIAAAGPRSNFVSGPQLVADPGYVGGDRRGLRDFARRWSEDHRGERTAVERLVGFCLAVRRDAFEEVGGFDEGYGLGGFEDDDLCLRLRQAGYGLVIVHDSFVHHVGHATFDANGVDWYALQQENGRRFAAAHRAPAPAATPLLSACMIVKDEEAMLPDCLAALHGLADEVVVYDTGSTDGTVEVARAAGARVVEGYWDDDFGRARNAALAECRGEWVLHVDADEVVVGDAGEVRAELAAAGKVDVLKVVIDNIRDDGSVGVRHAADRLFRRARAQWQGRLHEQVVPRPGQAPLVRAQTERLTIRHDGYRAEVFTAKDKAERNIRLATAELEERADGERAALLLNLARSLTTAGRFDEALARCAEARTEPHTSVLTRVSTIHHAVELLFALGRPAEALEWIDELRTLEPSSSLADFLAGTAKVLLGQPAPELLALDDDEIWNRTNAVAVSADTVRHRRALAQVAAQRYDEAAPTLLDLVRTHPQLALWAPLARSAHAAGVPAADVAEAVPDDGLRNVLAQLLLVESDAVDGIAEALWQRFEADARMVAFAVHHGRRCHTARALEWAARVRAVGLVDHCPLAARAGDPTVDPDERVRAAAVAHTAFGDARAPELLRAVAPGVPDAALAPAMVELDELAPDLLGPFVAAVAGIPARREALAAALDGVGAAEQAAVVRELSRQPFMSAR